MNDTEKDETPMDDDVEMCERCEEHPALPDHAGLCATCFDRYYDGPPDDDYAWSGGFADNH